MRAVVLLAPKTNAPAATPVRKGLACIVVLKAITDEGREALRRKAKRQPREPKGNQGGGRFVSQIEGLRAIETPTIGDTLRDLQSEKPETNK